MRYLRRMMPSFLDCHIESEDQDAFGHRHYAKALRCLLRMKGHQPSFTIGLLGGWGTGKSYKAASRECFHQTDNDRRG